MNKLIVALLLLFPFAALAGDSILQQADSYAKLAAAMSAFNGGDTKTAAVGLATIYDDSNIASKDRAYAVIAGAWIEVKSGGNIDGPIIQRLIQFSKRKDLPLVVKKDLLLSLSVRYRELKGYRDSFLLSEEALSLDDKDSALLFNFVVASVPYFEWLKQKPNIDSDGKKRTELVEKVQKTSKRFLDVSTDKRARADIHNALGRLASAGLDYSRAIGEFDKAIKENSKPQFYRNRAWAKLDWGSRDKKGTDKLNWIDDVISDLEKADKNTATLGALEKLKADRDRLRLNQRMKSK